MSTLTPLFNIFLERIITDALEDHEGTVSTGGRTITNLRFADNIDGLAGEEKELTKLVKRLDIVSTATAYSMEISAEKTMLMKNNEIEIKVLKLKAITSSSYLCSVITVEGGKPEMLSTIAQETAALLRCKPGVFFIVPRYD